MSTKRPIWLVAVTKCLHVFHAASVALLISFRFFSFARPLSNMAAAGTVQISR